MSYRPLTNHDNRGCSGHVKPQAPKKHPVQLGNLVYDVLLEILAWLAWNDWQYSIQHITKLASQQKSKSEKGLKITLRSPEGGYDLIRASHVCRYWRKVALSHKPLWRFVICNFNRQSNNLRNEFIARKKRSLGLTQTFCVAYISDSATGSSVKMKILAPQLNFGNLWHAPIYSHLLDHLPRASTIVLKAKALEISRIFGDSRSRLLRPVVYLGLPPATKDTLFENKLIDATILTELTIHITDCTQAIVFPSLPNLATLSVRVEAPSKPFLLPCKAGHYYSLVMPEYTGKVSYFEPVVTFPSLLHLKLEMQQLDFESLHTFLGNHASTLTAFHLESNGISLSAPSFVPVTPILLPKLRAIRLGQVSPHGLRHLDRWSCPSLKDLNLEFCNASGSRVWLNTSRFRCLRYLDYMFPQKLEAGTPLPVGNFISIILSKALPNLTELESLIIRNWHHPETDGVDWVMCLMPSRVPTPPSQRKPSQSQLVTSCPIPKADASCSTESRDIRHQSSIMWTSISADGLLLDKHNKPVPSADIRNRRTTREPLFSPTETVDYWECTRHNKAGDEGTCDEEREEKGEEEEKPPCSQLTETDASSFPSQMTKVDEGDSEDTDSSTEGTDSGEEYASDKTPPEEWDVVACPCPRLLYMRFVDCTSLEATSLFEFIQARTELHDQARREAPSPPLALRRDTIPNSEGEEDRRNGSMSTIPPIPRLRFDDCSQTQEEMEDLIAQYSSGERPTFRGSRSEAVMSPPLEERDLWF